MLDARRDASASSGAAQVLRPPEDGLPYLRHDRAGELRARAGAGDARRRPDRGARGRRRRRRCEIDATGCAVLPGFVDCHTHLPFAGWRAEEYELKVTGVPYEEIARARRRDRVVGAGARRGVRRRGARAGARRSRPRCSRTARRRSRARRATGSRCDGELRAAAARPRAGGERRRSDAVTGLFAHAVPRGLHRGRLDGRGGGARPRACDVDALDIYVESVAFAQRAPRARWARSRAEHGLPLRAHVEQFATQPLGAGRAGARARARSTTSRACTPTTSAPLAARRVRRRAAARRRVPGRRAASRRRARSPTRARSACSATDLNPGTSPVPSLPLVDRARGAPLRLDGARGAAGRAR